MIPVAGHCASSGGYKCWMWSIMLQISKYVLATNLRNLQWLTK